MLAADLSTSAAGKAPVAANLDTHNHPSNGGKEAVYMKVGFSGVGVVGNGMVKNLLKHGHQVDIYNRTRSKAHEALEAGAVWKDSVADCVREAEVVITIVGFPPDVEEVYSGAAGILENARPGTPVIDMTTTSPRLSQRIFQEAAKRGLSALDAPVSGGDAGARAGTLSIMVGGDQKDFEDAMPLFSCMGKNIILMGPAGSGQHTKAANQIAVAGATAAYTEALIYAEKTGLDPQKMLAAIGAGAAGSWQLTNMAPRALAGDFAPGFFVKHFIKDMKIVKEESQKAGVELEMLNTVLSLYEKMAEHGMENEGTQALIRYYREEEK